LQKVCIQGLGFVGAAMATAVAAARNETGAPTFDVVGLDLPTQQGSQRIKAINAGRFPFETTDPELKSVTFRAVATGNLRASDDPSEYETADIVIVDVHLDVDFEAKPPIAKLACFERAVAILAERVRAGTLVIVETTVPPGTTEYIVAPLIREGLRRRNLASDSVLIAHSYERVMPGRQYLKSITDIWRVYSGATEAAGHACEMFLQKIVNTEQFPLTRLNRPLESETTKLMENSFRAVNIAFIEEWARFAEQSGIDLGAIVSAIRMRPTHRNIMKPGFGVGGYCLTKDPLLVGVGARDILGLRHLTFPFCETAVRTNQKMPFATLALLERHLGGLTEKRILLLGASYREDVSDTRYSPSADFLLWTEERGAIVSVHDPLVDMLEDRMVHRGDANPEGYDAVVFAVAHHAYRVLEPAVWLAGSKPFVVDANMVLNPEQIEAFRKAGCTLKVIGRGDL
jgi:nucleotide sugar dehydrogenase